MSKPDNKLIGVLPAVKVSRITMDITSPSVAIHYTLPDDTTVAATLPLPEAIALVQLLHQATTQLAAKTNAEPQAELLARRQPCQSVALGHDEDARVSVLVIDKGLSSQFTFELTEDQTYALGAGVADAIKAFKQTPKKTH